MAHVVKAVECHPDRLVGGIYGPFDTFEQADTWAKESESSPDNFFVSEWTGQPISRKYDYRVYELEEPRKFEDSFPDEDIMFYPGCHDRP